MSSENPYPQPCKVSSAQSEREALAGLLLSVGPDAPTLCEGWSTRNLATHLVVREYRPDAAAGMFFKGLRKHLGDVTQEIEARPYGSIVEDFRSGPPKWNPMRYADSFVNLAENFIHHEDVRRGSGEAEPRDLPLQMRDELWRLLGQMSRVFLRNARVHVEFERTDATSPAGEKTNDVHHAGANTGEEVRVIGEAGELLLWLYGRDSAAQVELVESVAGALNKVNRQAL
ncbi:TIGR03085 family metal-binding protein [Corynebacterium urogenitale]